MNIKWVGDHFIEMDLDPAEIRRVCGFLGISTDDVCKVTVSILRSPLDTEKLHAKSRLPLDDARADTLELFPQCDDVDCR